MNSVNEITEIKKPALAYEGGSPVDLTADQRNAHNTEQKGKDKLASDDAASISSNNSICGREGDLFKINCSGESPLCLH